MAPILCLFKRRCESHKYDRNSFLPGIRFHKFINKDSNEEENILEHLQASAIFHTC
jgi:hypothetical protein